MAKNYRTTKGTFAQPPVTPEKQGEQTGRQTQGEYDGRFVGLDTSFLLQANGGSFDNPMAYPNYGMLYVGSPMVYRWMLQHPTLRLVRSIAVADILASQWEYRKTSPDVPDEQLDSVKENFDRLRTDLMCDFFIRGRDFGWYGGEPIWEVRDRETHLVRVKPLLPEFTHVLQDDFGNFIGLRNDVGTPGNVGGRTEIAAPYKAWKYTYDSEGGYHYGRSWLENCRMTAWRGWLDSSQQLQRLGAKITGTQIVVTTPTGSFPGPNNTTLYYRDVATSFIKSIATGGPGGWIPGINIPTDPRGKVEVAKIIAELIGKSQVSFQLLDFGSTTPAIAGLIEKMRHEEELMFEAGLRPARAGLEAKHGAKADAETHTDTGTKNSELDDRQFAVACQPLVDALLVLNFGENARGNICITTPPLVTNKLGLIRALLLSLCNNPAFVQALCDVLDIDDLLNFLDFVPLSGKKFQAKDMLEYSKVHTPKPPGTPEPQGGRPPST
jgi:hypothetical protein